MQTEAEDSRKVVHPSTSVFPYAGVARSLKNGFSPRYAPI